MLRTLKSFDIKGQTILIRLDLNVPIYDEIIQDDFRIRACLPTINYCSPMKIFEYMAAGRTIIAHDFPTIREVLQDGKDAILCKPGDFDSLKFALEKALTIKNHSTMGKIARDKAFNFYSWDNRVSKLIKFLNNS